MDFDERLARLEARANIAELAARYCHGADGRDADSFRSVWHPDAVWDVGAHRFIGHEQILEAVSRQWSMFRSMHHTTSNATIELTDSDRARGRHDVLTLTTLADGEHLLSTGHYEDIYSLRGGAWRLDERRAIVETTVSLPRSEPVGDPGP